MENSMNRADKIQKLSHAVRDWRGVFSLKTKIWRRHPQKRAEARVRHWLAELKRPDVDADIATIEGFQHFDQFHTWLSKIQQGENT